LKCTNPRGEFVQLDLGLFSNGDGLALLLREAAPADDTNSDQAWRQRLEILAEVAAALSSSRQLQHILRIILTGATAAQGLGFNRAFLFLYDEESACLRGHLAVGPRTAEEAGAIWRSMENQRLSLAELLDAPRDNVRREEEPLTDLIVNLSLDLSLQSAIGQACDRGQWLDLEHAEVTDATTTSLIERLGTRRVAVVPMLSKGRLHGLLAADNAITGKAVTRESIELLQILADQAAVAMERARLYESDQARSEQLEAANRQLAESQDQVVKFEKMSVIGELTAAVAHELRNPLAVVGGFANLMLKSDLTDEQREYVNIIASEIQRAEGVLGQVLDFSRASRSESQRVDLSRLAERTLGLLRNRSRATEAQIRTSWSRAPLPVFGNSDQLSHAVYEIFKLVLEEITASMTVNIKTRRRGNSARLSIGVVSSGEHYERSRKHLEQAFGTGHSSERLSVIVAAQTIKCHGGNYGLEAEADRPITIFMELPISEENHG
jgi:signal transduction histidine kinase